MDEKKKAKAEKGTEKKAKSAPAKAAAAKTLRRKASGKSAGELTTAVLRHIRMSPRKARLVVDMIRGQHVESALRMLRYSPKKASGLTEKLLRSAIANAREKSGADVDTLWVIGGKVDMGRTLKRFMPAAHGRAAPIRKRSTHITLYLGSRG